MAPGVLGSWRWLQVWDGYQSAGPPPPLGFPVGHQKVEQGSLAIPSFLKALRVGGWGWRQGRGWGAPGAGRKEEEGLAGRAEATEEPEGPDLARLGCFM